MSSRSKYIAKNITFGYIANIVALFLNFVYVCVTDKRDYFKNNTEAWRKITRSFLEEVTNERTYYESET